MVKCRGHSVCGGIVVDRQADPSTIICQGPDNLFIPSYFQKQKHLWTLPISSSFPTSFTPIAWFHICRLFGSDFHSVRKYSTISASILKIPHISYSLLKGHKSSKFSKIIYDCKSNWGLVFWACKSQYSCRLIDKNNHEAEWSKAGDNDSFLLLLISFLTYTLEVLLKVTES